MKTLKEGGTAENHDNAHDGDKQPVAAVVREVAGLPNQESLTAAIRQQVTAELEEKYKGWTPPAKTVVED